MYGHAREGVCPAALCRRRAPAGVTLAARRHACAGTNLSALSCCTVIGQTVECLNGRARTGARRRASWCYVTTVEGLTGLIDRSPPCTEGYERGGGCYCRRRKVVARVVERHLTESIWRSSYLETPQLQKRTPRGSGLLDSRVAVVIECVVVWSKQQRGRCARSCSGEQNAKAGQRMAPTQAGSALQASLGGGRVVKEICVPVGASSHVNLAESHRSEPFRRS